MQIDFDGFLFLFEHLALMRSGLAMQMQESIAISAEVSTLSAEDNGCSLSVVMVIAGRLRKKKKKKKTLGLGRGCR